MTRLAIVFGLLFASGVASADLENNAAIHEHVDMMLARGDVVPRDPRGREALLADRLTLSLGGLLPIYGTYELDHKVFGGVRPAAVAFDWILGGIVPAGLGITALATNGSLPSRTRSILTYTAIGLYASTRIGVLIIGNLHISEYNRYVKLRLGIAESTSGQLAPAVVASTSW